MANVARQFDHHEERIIHDECLMGNAAEGLLTSLHHALMLREGSSKLRTYYRTALSHSHALQCTVLVTAIEMMLRCSPETLAEHVHLIRKELTPALPRLVNLFLAWEGDENIRLLSITNAVVLVRRVGPLCQEATEQFVEALLQVLRAFMGSAEIHVQAANAIAHIFDRQDRTIQRKLIIQQIQSDSSLLISTLSTAALAAANRQEAEEVLMALFHFAVNSRSFRTKMAKRRCTVLAIGKHLRDEYLENRKVALNICKCLLNDHLESASEPAILDQNTSLLVTQVTESATNERDPLLQVYAVSLLGDAVQHGNLLPESVDLIMGTLRDIVDSDGQDEVVLEAALTYIKVAVSLQPEDTSNIILTDVADFTTLPFARARQHAIAAIDYYMSDDTLAIFLLHETELIENFSLIISYGSDEDCADTMDVVRQCAGNERHHQIICQSNNLLQAIVQLVTKEEITNQHAHTIGVEAILALMSNVDNVKYFLPYTDLLPCLVSMANETTEDEEIKQRLVSSIVRLSSAILG